MRQPTRAAAGLSAVASMLLPLVGVANAQTWSSCNPLQSTSCPANTALGMTINVDFTNGAVNSFASSGSVSYDDANGASFTVAQGGDAPQLNSLFYIMFGRVEITMKAAPGAGIVSSLVLESDDLDEIDIEWLGSNPDEMQSNYFGKGLTTSYNRGQFHAVDGTQDNWITYTIDWTKDRIVWMADGTVVREMAYDDAEENQYPQTPMQVKFGSWAGGDPNYNAPGTVDWARGPTDYSQGPFSMLVQRIVITDYSTGDEYSYGDTSGSWESIRSEGGAVNGNINNRDAITVTASAEGTVATPATENDNGVPVGGLADDGSGAAVTQVGSIPDGWRMTEEGKLLPEGAASTIGRPSSTMLALLSLSLAVRCLSEFMV